jgi:hypothetical protein
VITRPDRVRRGDASSHLARQARRPRRHVPDPRITDPTTSSCASPPPASAGPTCTSTRCSARSSTRATSWATSRWGSWRRWGRRSPRWPPATASCAVQRQLRHVLDVLPGPAEPVRDHPGARAGLRRGAARLHQAVRAGARRAGGVPARPVRQHAADPGAARPAGRPLRLPLRRAPHGVAGRRLRRPPAGGASRCSGSARSGTCAPASRATAAWRT